MCNVLVVPAYQLSSAIQVFRASPEINARRLTECIRDARMKSLVSIKSFCADSGLLDSTTISRIPFSTTKFRVDRGLRDYILAFELQLCKGGDEHEEETT